MNRDLFSGFSEVELQENINRLQLAIEELQELHTDLQNEQAELKSTRDMLLQTLGELAPKDKLVGRFVSAARNAWRGFWESPVQGQDKEEWEQIMKEMQ